MTHEIKLPPVSEFVIRCEDDEPPLLKLIDHFYALGCRYFYPEDNHTLWLRWPDGRQQKIIVDEGTPLQ